MSILHCRQTVGLNHRDIAFYVQKATRILEIALNVFVIAPLTVLSALGLFSGNKE